MRPSNEEVKGMPDQVTGVQQHQEHRKVEGICQTETDWHSWRPHPAVCLIDSSASTGESDVGLCYLMMNFSLVMISMLVAVFLCPA
ncbi:hypothetical protein E2C01_084509 [Portunus trituberculatus]|uniref:Uncharacterized protein n=1 Tax=Portunus trituberculatus TaxID=210409 RepID=A0A5B7J469_PORTR|nr:hypothetical protein [Portunus trituberculatus]